MTAYTADDFKNARFATHPDGRIAMRRNPGKHNAWFTSNGSIPSDINMAQCGWVPVRECPDPEVHEGRGDDDRTIPWKTAALNWEYRAEKAEQERDSVQAALVCAIQENDRLRADQPRSLAADDITDEMVERGAEKFKGLPYAMAATDRVRCILRAALTSPPSRPAGAEGVETALLDADEAGVLASDQERIERLADFLAERGVRVTGAES